MKWHDRDWMIYRVLRQDPVVGKNFSTGRLDRGNLELSLFNIVVASTFSLLGYVSFAPFVVNTQKGTINEGQHKKQIFYNIKRKEQVTQILAQSRETISRKD